MGLFGFGKNRDVVDLAERYRRQKERESGSAKPSSSESSSNAQEQSPSPFSFFDSGSSSSSGSGGSGSYEFDSDGFVDITSVSTDKRRKLAKRILDMTTKLEDVSNQLYHLQQRLEVIERKLNVKSFD